MATSTSPSVQTPVSVPSYQQPAPQPVTFEQIQAFCQTNQSDVCILFNTQVATANTIDTQVKELDKSLKARLDFLSVAGIVEMVVAAVIILFAAWAYKKRKEI